MSDDDGVWLYAITRRLDPTVLTGLAGVAGETLRVVAAAGFAAVAGSVPLSSFGEQALHRNFEDLDWLAATARAHNAVVHTVVRAGPTVPIRLATVYHDDERVELVLRQRAQDFDRALAHVEGRTEWGVKVFLDPGQGRETQASTPAGGRPPGGGAGTAYLQRRRAQLKSRERAEHLAVEQAERIHSALSSLAADACTHPLQSPTLAGNTQPMILNAAYLVDDEVGREFTRAAASYDQEHEGVRLQLTGPWPPYSFSALEAP
jgi:hypothetical protein